MALCSFASASVPTATMNRLKSLYPLQSENFINLRLTNAKSPLEKWTAFPPYYYQLLDRLQLELGVFFKDRQGLCAGDAHWENFGYLYMGQSHFGLNDLDDTAVCSLNADAMRLYLGHRLITKNYSTQDWLESYASGVRGEKTSLPRILQELKNKSEELKNNLPNKMKRILDSKNCDGEYGVLNSQEIQVLKAYKNSFVFGCTRIKTDGGSAGNKRYLVFYENGSEVAVEELKPLLNPAPNYQRSITQTERENLYRNSVEVFLGKGFSSEYFPVRFGNVSFQRRPLWAGNQAIKLDEISPSEYREVILYEAWRLGVYHNHSRTRVMSIDAQAWDKYAEMILSKWFSEF